MAKLTDLYPILRAYAAKTNSPYIEIDVFLSFLENYAKHKVEEQPEWGKWLTNASVQFWSELSGLAENEKCVLVDDSAGGHVYMPFFYTDMLQEIYRDLDKDADLPFPNEESLRISIPENQLSILNLKADLGDFFVEPKDEDAGTEGEPDETNSAVKQIVKLIFPDDCPSALLLTAMIPRRLAEASFLKVRHYLRSRGNKEFVLHKLAPQMQGKEKYLREILDQLLIRPMDCLNSMEQSGDFSYVFWTYFCSLVRTDIKKRNEVLSEDIAVMQAVNIIEVCNSFYRALAVKKREREIAFRNLELCMGKPPFYFTREDILKFTTDKAVQLVGMYSTGELDSYIKKKISESANAGELPDWFTLKGSKNELWYIKKEKYLSLCARMLVNTRPLIRKAVSKRWTALLKEFRSEPAMEKDAEYEKMLGAYTKEFNPPLTAMLSDQKLLWVYDETERLQGAAPPAHRFFRAGSGLLPLSVLYAFRRKDLLNDAKMLLPFWHSMPILTAIIAFFKRLLGKKKKKQPVENIEVEAEEIVESKIKDADEIRGIAESVQNALVPPGQTLDEYLAELEARWNRLLDIQSRQNLADDIQSLVRDNLRKILRVHRTRKITQESLDETTSLLISSSPALRGLSGQDSLHLYIELYMVKMLLNVR